MEPKPLSLERRMEIQYVLDRARGESETRVQLYRQDLADLLQEVERLEEEVRQARGNRQ